MIRKFEQDAIVNELMIGVHETIDKTMKRAKRNKDIKTMEKVAIWYKNMETTKNTITDKLAVALLDKANQGRIEQVLTQIMKELEV
jgi:hypothetical protein|tara:strand:- start:1018 stop:1275 length:258 start_codon:yes stop_codon:yes gene_type:complete